MPNHEVTLFLRDAAGRQFCVRDRWTVSPLGHDAETDSGVEFYYTQGNMSCDCNRADLIQAQCDPEYPELECGDTITLERLLFDDVEQDLS